jgi:hypothetical protein
MDNENKAKKYAEKILGFNFDLLDYVTRLDNLPDDLVK